MTKPVGLLTLQGDFEKHRRAFAALDCATRGVRRPADLAEVSSLVIPGGESTTLTRLIDRNGLRAPLAEFAGSHAVMGTCAGLILLATELEQEGRDDYGVAPLGLLDCTVRRNAYGRQIDSFTAPVDVSCCGDELQVFPAVFIRAPRITAVGPEAEVVASLEGEPVGVRQGRLLGLTFHPELTDDLRLHRAFLDLVD